MTDNTKDNDKTMQPAITNRDGDVIVGGTGEKPEFGQEMKGRSKKPVTHEDDKDHDRGMTSAEAIADDDDAKASQNEVNSTANVAPFVNDDGDNAGLVKPPVGAEPGDVYHDNATGLTRRL